MFSVSSTAGIGLSTANAAMMYRGWNILVARVAFGYLPGVLFAAHYVTFVEVTSATWWDTSAPEGLLAHQALDTSSTVKMFVIGSKIYTTRSSILNYTNKKSKICFFYYFRTIRFDIGGICAS